MPKTIKVEVDVQGIQEIFSEWMGRHISKAEASKVLGQVKKQAEEELSREAFRIISGLIERL